MMDGQTKKSKNFLYLFGLFLVLFFFLPITVTASDASAGATGFTYDIVFPENQMAEDVGYFRLKMAAGQKQTISIALGNPGTETVTVEVSLNGAKTNQNGVIEYGETSIENDASLKFDFVDIVTGPESIELAPGETKNLDLEVQMPDTGYEGLISGGIQLMKADSSEASEESSGSVVINKYAYIVGCILQESDVELKADLQLNSVYAGQTNSRNTIFVNFSNVIAEYLNDVTTEVQIHKKDSETILYDTKQTGMRMAPNTFIDFPVSMNGERMEDGEYTAEILVTGGDDGRWQWSQDFTITKEDADKFNERDIGLVQEKGVDWQLIIGIVAGIVLAVVVLVVAIQVMRKRKAKKQQQKKRQKKNQRK